MRIVRQILRLNGCGAIGSRTYSNCREHVLELVDQRDESRVIDIDPAQRSQYQHPGDEQQALTNSPPVWPP